MTKLIDVLQAAYEGNGNTPATVYVSGKIRILKGLEDNGTPIDIGAVTLTCEEA